MKILIVDDEAAIRKAIEYDFKERKLTADFAQDGKEAQNIFDEYEHDIVILDIKMPKLDGITVLKYILKKAPETKVIMISAHGTIELAVEAMKIGAVDFIEKPFSLDDLNKKLQKLFKEEGKKVKNNNINLLTGKSEVFLKHIKMLDKLAKVDSTVLITGESGTGKEVAAKYIHENSQRKNKSFIPVNCASLSKELLASELFGHKKGSFTGAVDDRIGKFEAADGGTLFLDEVGEIDIELQAKLLRALQENEIEVIGESKPKKINVRVLAATNRELEDSVKHGIFREDLFYRLNVINVDIPPLRERKEDIKVLTEQFLRELSESIGVGKKEMKEDVYDLFEKYTWPGNIRELKNSIERAIVLSEEDILSTEDFDFLNLNIDNFLNKKGENNQNMIYNLESQEKETIINLMKESKNKTELAKKLGIKRTTLLYKMKKYDIEF